MAGAPAAVPARGRTRPQAEPDPWSLHPGARTRSRVLSSCRAHTWPRGHCHRQVQPGFGLRPELGWPRGSHGHVTNAPVIRAFVVRRCPGLRLSGRHAPRLGRAIKHAGRFLLDRCPLNDNNVAGNLLFSPAVARWREWHSIRTAGKSGVRRHVERCARGLGPDAGPLAPSSRLRLSYRGVVPCRSLP